MTDHTRIRLIGSATMNMIAQLGLILVSLGNVASASSIRRSEVMTNDRIVGGTLAENHSRPYMVLITFRLMIDGKMDIAICGGNLISPLWIVTAAHCKLEEAQDYKLHLGMNSWCKDNPSQIYYSDGHVEREIAEFIIHQWYNKYWYMNDIAMIKMDKPVEFSKNIQAIRLPKRGPIPEMVVSVAGWGRIAEDKKVFSCDLREVVVKVFSDEVCMPMVGGDKTHFCAGWLIGGKDSCQGDSGSGLVTEHKGIFVLHGIVSYGSGCARRNELGFYTRVKHFTPWISEFLAKSTNKKIPPIKNIKNIKNIKQTNIKNIKNIKQANKKTIPSI